MLILTRNDAIKHLANVTVAPLTRTIRNIPSEVILSPADGVPSVCAVSLENIMTIRQASLDRAIACLSVERMEQVFGAIRFVFSMTS